jgi:hypothetical protein
MVLNMQTDKSDLVPESIRSIKLLYQIDRKSVCVLKFLIEAYDGIAQLKTIDPYVAVVELNVAPGCESVVGQLLESLTRELSVRRIG